MCLTRFLMLAVSSVLQFVSIYFCVCTKWTWLAWGGSILVCMRSKCSVKTSWPHSRKKHWSVKVCHVLLKFSSYTGLLRSKLCKTVPYSLLSHCPSNWNMNWIPGRNNLNFQDVSPKMGCKWSAQEVWSIPISVSGSLHITAALALVTSYYFMQRAVVAQYLCHKPNFSTLFFYIHFLLAYCHCYQNTI